MKKSLLSKKRDTSIVHLSANQQVLVDPKENEFRGLKSILHALPGCVYWKDRNGVYLGCNNAALALAGTNVVGKTDFDLPWKSQAAEMQRTDEEVFKKNILLELEESFTLANGQSLTMLTRKAPLKDAQGNTVGIIGIWVDIADRVRLQEVLKEAYEQALAANIILQKAKEQADMTLDNIVASMPGHVYWKDKNGVYLGCNNRQAQSFGFQYGSEVIGKTDFTLPWIAGANTLRANDIRVMQTGQTETVEESAQMDGKDVIVLSQKTPLKNKQGVIEGVLGISTDITNRKKFEADLKVAKEKAEAANKAKAGFLENMRHDIRTPLMGIISFAGIISEEVNDPKIKGYVENLNASSNALLDLLNEILELIKVSSGDIPILKKKFDFKKRLTEVIKLNQAKALHKQIDLVFDHDNQIPRYLIGDSTRIHRIALELIANALNFTKQGSVRLVTQLAKSDDRGVVVKLIVEDTGIGIEPETQQEIFLQFKRLTPSYEGIYKGAGLGLTIVKQFMDELQGEVYVQSTVGEGSKFICVLPLKKALLDEDLGSEDLLFTAHEKKQLIAIPAKPAEDEKIPSRPAEKSRILIVEDQLIAITVAQRMFSSLDCHVDVASDGNTAVQLSQKNKYDLIIMDVGLPDISGYEVTKRIRQHEASRSATVPIIALSAHIDEENKQHCLEVGMNAVLSKPLDKDRAKELLDAFIPCRKNKREELNNNAPEDIAALFMMENKIIDMNLAKRQLGGNEEVVEQILNMLVNTFAEERAQLKAAYEKSDWNAIQKIAHKLKGGSSYCGAARLREICSLIEVTVKKEKQELYGPLLKRLEEEMVLIENAVKNETYKSF